MSEPTHDPPSEPTHDPPSEPTEGPSTIRAAITGLAHPTALAVLGAAAVGALIGRFVVSSPMWLDEALSVHISALPLSRIPAALRHDGHPPLYYVLLHLWMSFAGSGDRAVRALSGVTTLVTIPLAWAAGRRVGGRRLGATVAFVFVVSPYALRYGSETRMYALVIALVFALFILLSDSLSRPATAPVVGVSAVSCLLLWTHYWSMWLLGAIGVWLIVSLVRTTRPRGTAGSGDASDASPTMTGTPIPTPPTRRLVELLVALAVAGIGFLPWLGTLLYQAHRTGTPWSPPFRPSALIYSSLVEFAGGPYSEPQLLLLVMAVFVFLGLTGRTVDHRRIAIDLYTRPESHRPVGLLVGTVAIASIAGAVTGMAFAPRYASVFFPFFVVLVALGIDRLGDGRPRDIALVAFTALSVVGLYLSFSLQRSQAGVVADHVRRATPSGLVVACPDQLGPSTRRQLEPPEYEVVSYPRLDDSRFVDWVDYARRNRRNDPTAVADEVLARAGDRPIVVVYRDDFLTLRGQCARLLARLAEQRSSRELEAADGDRYYEPMSAVLFERPGR